jgi:hypothetical protein
MFFSGASFLEASWSSHSVAQDQLSLLQRFVRLPAGAYVVQVQAGNNITARVLIPTVLETLRMRAAGVVYDTFNISSLDAAKAQMLLSFTGNVEAASMNLSVNVKTVPGVLNQGGASVTVVQQSVASLPHVLPVSVDGSLLITASSTCQQTTIVGLRQSTLPLDTSVESVDSVQDTLVFSDSLPSPDMIARIRLLFPTPVQQEESLSVKCTIGSTIQHRLRFVGDSAFQLSRSSMTSTLAGNSMYYNGQMFPYGLNVAVTATFNKITFQEPSIIYGDIQCRVEAAVPARLADGLEPLIPSYMTQNLSVGVVWLSTAWPLFGDIVVETDTRVGSIWTPPADWTQVSVALATVQNRTTNSTEKFPLWTLDDDERTAVLSFVSRTPTFNEPFSFALSAGDMNISLIADSGFWFTAADSGTLTRGPFKSNTIVSLAGKACSVSWVSANGRALRVTLPSLAFWCAAQTGLAKNECDSLAFKITTVGISDEALANLVNEADSTSVATARQTLADRSAKTARALAAGSSGVLGLSSTISCPPFCPGGSTYLLEPYIAGLTWASRNESASARTTSSMQSSLMDSTELGLALGISFSKSCVHLGFEPVPQGTGIFSGRCMNVSSGALCAYVQGGVCSVCPAGALCPGNAYILPLKGYWSAGFPTDPLVERCPPPSTIRCLGYNTSPFSLSCGTGYSGRLCSVCAKGYYTGFDEFTGNKVCLRCNIERNVRYTPVAIFFASLVIFGICVTFASWIATRRYGGSLVGSIKRSAKFVLFVFLCAQYLVQVGKATKTAAGVAPVFRMMLTWLEALQFSGLMLPPECLNKPPFSTEIVQAGLMLAALCILFVLTLGWAGALRVLKRMGCTSVARHVCCSEQREPPEVTGKGSRRRLLASGWAVLMKPVVYRQLVVMFISILFALTCNACFGIIKCDAEKPMRVSMYLSLSNDGSSLNRAGVNCAGGSCSSSLSAISPEILRRVIPVSVVSKYPGFVCGESDHRRARSMAVFVVLLMALFFPFMMVSLLYRRLRRLAHEFFSPLRPRIIRRPCTRWKGSLCIRFSAGLCFESCREKPRISVGMIKKNSDVDVVDIEGKSPSVSRQPGGAPLDIAYNEEFVDMADTDPFFGPLVEKEFLPSTFYFRQLNHMLALILSISLTYLDGYENAWDRLLLNSFAILGLLGLLLTTKPYRKAVAFSAHVQVSVLFLSYLVTLTGFTGTLSSMPISTRYQWALGNSTDFEQLFDGKTNSSSLVINKYATIRNPSIERATTVMSYVTLSAMGIVALFLLLSFFGSLKVGAQQEQDAVALTLVSKVAANMVAKGRAAMLSLRPAARGKDSPRPNLGGESQGMKGMGTLPPSSATAFNRLPFSGIQSLGAVDTSGLNLRLPGETGGGPRNSIASQAFLQKNPSSKSLMDRREEVSNHFAPVQSRPQSGSVKRNSDMGRTARTPVAASKPSNSRAFAARPSPRKGSWLSKLSTSKTEGKQTGSSTTATPLGAERSPVNPLWKAPVPRQNAPTERGT